MSHNSNLVIEFRTPYSRKVFIFFFFSLTVNLNVFAQRRLKLSSCGLGRWSKVLRKTALEIVER